MKPNTPVLHYLKPAFLFLFVILLLCNRDSHAAEVKNDRATMEGNRVVWEYDIEGKEGQVIDVTLIVKIEGKIYEGKNLHLEGDVGNVTPGKGKKLMWSVLQDFPRGLSSKIDWELRTSEASFIDPTIGMEFMFVKGGCYRMGDTFGDGNDDEKPVHEVCVADFYMGKYEVTQGEWVKVMGDNPSYFKKGDRYPVEQISWNDTQDFLKKMSSQSGKDYRLPTEAEWEYAARSGGKNEKWAGTYHEKDLGIIAWQETNSESSTHPVGEKQPNGLGLFDMSGNVWEWCLDAYEGKYYAVSPRMNPNGPPAGTARVLRGGAWTQSQSALRTTSRALSLPFNTRYNSFGFRVVFPAIGTK